MTKITRIYIGPLYFIYIQLLNATPEVHPSIHLERPYPGGSLPLLSTSGPPAFAGTGPEPDSLG